MTDTCIVCLGDLRVAPEPTIKRDPDGDDELAAGASPLPVTAANESKSPEDEEIIAHLLPCGHNMHDSCLRPWVERANSCPICRAQFSSVELRKYLDTPAFSSYAVQDKQQQADLDPTLIVEEDLFDVDEPCIVCGVINNDYEAMFCDGCDRTVHVFCAGYVDSPDVWYCQTCLRDLDSASNPSGRGTVATTRRRAGQPGQPVRRRGRRPHYSEWDRVWQQVWARLDLDLDFPFDDSPSEPRRTQTQRHELEAWQQRLQIANRQGGGNRFRDTASTLLHRHNPPPAPESQEEIRAWNAFDKAMHYDEEERPSNRRKRKSTSTSPSPRDSDAAPERKLKRPRTRRNQPVAQPGPSTARPVQSNVDQPSFLTSLLQEVEKQPAPSEKSSLDNEASGDEQLSPYVLSPATSPMHSGMVSPRALSVTPPPQTRPRPTSPMPLTSIVRPALSPPPFSPYSPATSGAERSTKRARPLPAQPSSPVQPSSPASPSRNMSYSTKTECLRMVKAVLGPRYRDNEITKEQYTDINRDVSRLLYDKVGGAEGLANQEGRDKWQQFANDEVERAVEAIRAEQQHDEEVKPEP